MGKKYQFTHEISYRDQRDRIEIDQRKKPLHEHEEKKEELDHTR